MPIPTALTTAALALAALSASARAQETGTEQTGTEQTAAPEPVGAFQPLTFDEAKARAAEAKKVVMIDFYTEWCGPCQKMDETTWRNPEVVEWLEAETVPIKVQAEREFSISQGYDVHQYPTLLFLQPDGKEIRRHIGYIEPQDFLDMANKALYGKSTVERAKEACDAHPDDPTLRQRYGEKLAQARRYPQALEAYLWCFDEGAQHNPAFAGVRTTYLLSDLERLARVYPPAGAALKERAKQAEDKLLAGQGTVETAHELAALCEHAGTPGRTVEVWDQMRAAGVDPKLAEAMFDAVFDALMEQRRYADVVASAGDVPQRVDALVQRYGTTTAGMGDTPDEELVAFLREQVVHDGARYYEALVGAGRTDVAQQVVDKLLAFQESGQTYTALVEAAARAEAWDAARALARRGLSELPRGQQFLLKRAAEKLPKEDKG
jgi:thiol-disulfide isomerase/thioredoxin